MNYKAFISSTYLDLKDHRARVIDALRKAGIIVDPMEDWSADSDGPKKLSLENIKGCNLFILLVGARRGERLKGETLSITQMEYNEARRLGIDMLVFLYDGKGLWLPEFYELDKDPKLKEWRKELTETHTTIGSFTHEPASLDTPVRDALNRWIQKQPWSEVRRHYLENLRKEHAIIRFLGIGYYKDIKDCPIEDLFVNPFVSEQHISPDTPPEEWPETTPLLDALRENNRLVLLGDPGSGKSTLVDWIVWNLTSEKNNRWKKALDHRFPIVMVLRELELEAVRSWEDLLNSFFQHRTSGMLKYPSYCKEVRKLLESGRCMIIIDGLDEVGNPAIQKRLKRAIQEGMLEKNKCCWLLTSRLVGYLNYHEFSSVDVLKKKSPDLGTRLENVVDTEDTKLMAKAFLALKAAQNTLKSYSSLQYVAPFTDEQVAQFAQNWFTARDQAGLRAKEEADKLRNAIHSNPYTLRLARTPNLLTMMALIYRERARLPHGRALLYTDIADAYLQSIDEHRRIERLGYPLRTQKLCLGRIGFEMQLRRYRKEESDDKDKTQEILAEGKDIREWIISAMKDSGEKDNSVEATEALLDEICRRSGLLIPKGEDQYAFVHLSFQEFFAAVFLLPQFLLPPRRQKIAGVSGARPKDLAAYANKEVWQESLMLLVELMFAEQPNWLEELLYSMFGENFSQISSHFKSELPEEQLEIKVDKKIINKVTLLARLTVDPHAGLGKFELKWPAIEVLCKWDAAWQKNEESKIVIFSKGFYDRYLRQVSYKPIITNILLSGGLNEQNKFKVFFKRILAEAGIKALSFFGVPIDDISEFSSLPDVYALDLSNSNLSKTKLLCGFSSVKFVSLLGTQISKVSDLSCLTSLQSLSLENTQISEVSGLSGLSNLQNLYLQNTQISEVSSLLGLPNLQNLSLRNTQISDVNGLSGLSNLQSLNLENTQISDVSGLLGLSNLQNLNLENTQINDVSGLSGLSNLRILILKNTRISDMSGLLGLSNLQNLNLENTRISDVSGLSGLSNLQNLNLDNTQISDVSGLSGLSNLQNLNLKNTQIRDVSDLLGLSNLRVLNLDNTQISEESDLSGLSNLRILFLKNTQISEAKIKRLKETLPNSVIYY